MLLFQLSTDVTGDVEEVKAEDEKDVDEVWDTMETVTEKSKKRAAQKEEAVVTGEKGKKKRKVAKK